MNLRPPNIPLTQTQQLIYAGQRISPDSPQYNVPYIFRIHGEIEPKRFNRAFQSLVSRFDALRISIDDSNDTVSQVIAPKLDYIPELIDLGESPKNDIIEAFLKERSQRIFDLKGPLFDAALIPIHKNQYIWYLNLHHLITDAVSVGLMYKAMEELYRTDISENRSEVENFSFVDFALYENEVNSTLLDDPTQLYWKENITKYREPLGYYGFKGRSSTSVSERSVFTIEGKQANIIRKRAQQAPFQMISEKLAIYNIFASALALYIRIVGAAERFAIGSPVHNRDNRNRAHTVGLLMEIYPLFLEVSADDTIQDLIEKVKTSSFEMLRNTRIGMVNADISRSFNVLLNYIPWHFGKFDGKEVEVEWLHPGHCDPGHFLRCQILDPGEGEMQLIFDLNCAVFSEDKRERALSHFEKALNTILLAYNTTVAEVELVDKLEINELINKAQSPYTQEKEVDFLNAFEQNASKWGDKSALIQDGESLSYQSLNQRANMLGKYLLEEGIRPEDRVGVYLTRSMDYIISLIALMKIGAVFVPIPSDTPVRRVQYMLKNSECSCCISHDGIASQHIREISLIDIGLNRNQIFDDFDSEYSLPEQQAKVAYHLYTSGSTGQPKGVVISRKALNNYLNWAAMHYGINQGSVFPLFTSIGFDLTISSTFLPLMKGGTLIIYKEPKAGPDLSLFRIISENRVNTIKLTPSHINMIYGKSLGRSLIRTVIVGGEDFKSNLADELYLALDGSAAIYNEYGPTEATVGCVAYRYTPDEVRTNSVPIGRPISNMCAYVLNKHLKLLPSGVAGELFISGKSLADGYHNLPEANATRFIKNPFQPGSKMYKTGDLVRWNEKGQLDFLGREDEQVKFNGYRVELSDIESNLGQHDQISDVAVVLVNREIKDAESQTTNCARCGLPSSYPNADFDHDGICHLCNAFDGYKERVGAYFKSENELRDILMTAKESKGEYDCLSLLSGGKDSTYVLARLVGMGLKVLAFTLDNGYISDQAKENVDKIVAKLGVDHVYGETEHMNKIFVDSLHRHANVCNGCFKTIYTLSTQVALEKNIPFVVTGLSRGQFFETRLTEELFWKNDYNSEHIDSIILEARKLYHREQDAISDLMEVSMFHEEDTFERVKFIDFYRYSDVSLQELLKYLKEKVDWKRPTDTGRSTNCLINQLGIYVHKKEKGYSNYAFPYSWDVRLGHKQRDESLEEINEEIDEQQVKKIMREIGYAEKDTQSENMDSLVAYYVSPVIIGQQELREFLKERLPSYMMPGYFKRLEAMPLNKNGKTDKITLKSLNKSQIDSDVPYMAPRNDIESLLSNIWKEVLQLKKIGIFDNFITLGGHSLAAIRITARINEELQLNFPLNKIFDLPTIAEYGSFIEKTLLQLMEDENRSK